MRARTAPDDIETVFMGGGTPSLLSLEQWHYLQKKLLVHLPIKKGAEWTIECNPASFTDEKADAYAASGVTRLTFGVQTLNDRERRVLGRRSSGDAVRQLLKRSSLRSFTSIGVDLMYGIPGQTEHSFMESLDEVVSCAAVHHLSAYELTIATSTAFGRHLRLLPLPDDDAVMGMTRYLFSHAASRGFSQYEISNFAREGHESRHNIGYWSHVPYIGLGASAHSYYGGIRWWNVANRDGYCATLEQGRLPTEMDETIDAETIAREMLFLGLRQNRGLDETAFLKKTGVAFTDWVDAAVLQRFIDEGYLRYNAPWWQPTEKGLLSADYCARELF